MAGGDLKALRDRLTAAQLRCLREALAAPGGIIGLHRGEKYRQMGEVLILAGLLNRRGTDSATITTAGRSLLEAMIEEETGDA